MLLNKEWNEAQEMKVVLQETPQCCDYFDKFLAFFYKGKISLAINECLPILCLADKYNVKVGWINPPNQYLLYLKNYNF